MAIPIQFQQFKSAGIYRVVYDKSAVLGEDAELLRLVVGYSPKGPFNTPVYVKSVSEFKSLYGDVSKSLEKNGCFFHRTCIQALSAGPILCLNLKPFDEKIMTHKFIIKDGINNTTYNDDTIPVINLYDTSKFWKLDPQAYVEKTMQQNFLNIVTTTTSDITRTVFIRKPSYNKVRGYDIPVADWYKTYNEQVPAYLDGIDKKISDFFTEVYVFDGTFTKESVALSQKLNKYFAEAYTAEDVVVINGVGYIKNTLATPSVPGVYTENEIIKSSSVELGTILEIDSNNKVLKTKEKLSSELSQVFYVDDKKTYYADNVKKVDAKGGKIYGFGAVIGSDSPLTEGIYLEANLKPEDNGKFTLKTAETKPLSMVTLTDDCKLYALIDNKDASLYDDFSKTAMKVDKKYYITTTLDKEGKVAVASKRADGTLMVKDKIENAFGDETDGLDALFADSAAGGIAHYVACMLPGFYDPATGSKSIDVLFNMDSDNHGLMMTMNEALLEDNGIKNTIENSFALKDTDENRYIKSLTGYTYPTELSKPKFATPESKHKWQKEIIGTINKYKGLKDALLSKAEIDYRYIVDSFDSYYYDAHEMKSELALLAKEKELCFAILNFPSIKNLVKDSKFVDTNNVFNINGIKNIKLPSEPNGASFCAFYTQLKFSNGYIDTIVPSAGLVSNLFIEKYANRHPYSIVAGPNYANIKYPNLVGPDYHFSQEELHILEPYGVNALIYRPTFGTFVNSNQTAKQMPKTALSSINVRELVIYLQDEIGKVLQSYQWEFNTVETREAIKSKADIICERAKSNGGIMQYLNVMDESNNTPDIIDNEMCVLSTHIEPGRGAGKMIHELTIYRTGGMSSMIKEG